MGAYLHVWVLACLLACVIACAPLRVCAHVLGLPESAGCSTHPLSRSFALCTQPHLVAFLSVTIVRDSKHISPLQLVCTYTAQVDHFPRASASCTVAVYGCGWSRTRQKDERAWIRGWVGWCLCRGTCSRQRTHSPPACPLQSIYDYGPRTVRCPLVFLPPATGTADVFYKQIVSLGSAGFRVLAVEYPIYW